ncbi:MAG: hypothetical protein NZM11_00800 [Anaerolineales bacterium]|nr:hypothetical protein [Anaerolineales bacterium]
MNRKPIAWHVITPTIEFVGVREEHHGRPAYRPLMYLDCIGRHRALGADFRFVAEHEEPC